jgi:hypothetical protein
MVNWFTFSENQPVVDHEKHQRGKAIRHARLFNLNAAVRESQGQMRGATLPSCRSTSQPTIPGHFLPHGGMCQERSDIMSPVESRSTDTSKSIVTVAPGIFIDIFPTF